MGAARRRRTRSARNDNERGESEEPTMREVLLHGGVEEAFDRSVTFAKQLAESFGARLHVLYTIEDPLSAGWTAEVSAERMPEVHEAMEAEARERLSAFISAEDQERLDVQIALGTGPAEDEVVRYANEHAIDLVIVQSAPGSSSASDLVRSVLDQARCAVLVLR
jgi:nucleotide-binding universal stress UspA family protein